MSRFSGNLERFSTEDDHEHGGGGGGDGLHRKLRFRPFLENRETFHVRRRNEKNPYLKGKIELVHASGVDRVLHTAKLDLTKVISATS